MLDRQGATNTDGGMLVANASVENLLCSREDESEGRRRAVVLNNMLFSAVLSGAVTAGTEPVRRELLLADPQEGSDLLCSKLKMSTELDACATILRTDRQKVKQILLNLLSNALKFTHEGSVTVIASDKPVGEVWLAVADTGIGIASENQHKVFEDFHQVDSSLTREYGGTGLGLAICARLATMLGGRITLTGELGKGSIFTLILPQPQEDDA